MFKTKKDLRGLLLLGGLALLLAAMAPGAWATPNQSPLRQTVPQGDVIVTNAAGDEKNDFTADEIVYATAIAGSFAGCPKPVDIYVVVDDLWTDGKAITADVSGGVETVNCNGADGSLGPVAVWNPPLVPGGYDVVFDANQDQVFNAGDGVDDAVLGTGFVVQSVPLGGIATYPNRFKLIAPWIRLAVLMAVVAAVVFGLRRQGNQP